MDLKLSLTASLILGQTKQVQRQSKEQFFSIKKPTRRTKTSKIQQSETVANQNLSTPESLHDCQIIKRLHNLDVKELHYSLAETEDPGVILQFKSKQPKKKKLPSKIYSTDLNQIKSSSSPKKVFQQPKNFKRINNPSKFTPSQSENIEQNYSQNSKSKKQRIEFYQPKKIISKTLTSLFQNEIPIFEERQSQQLTIEDFHIIQQIGDGTYSKVYRVVNKKTGFVCALKILQKDLMKQLKVMENAIRQIKILSCLSNHPNITTLYGSFTDQQYIYLILQLCTDGDVHKKMKKLRQAEKIPIKSANSSPQKAKHKQEKQMTDIVDLIRQICLSLKELHENSIIHRDIKPQNILVTMGNNVKMSDFGWSVHNPKSNLRKTLCGTPLYLAPQFITTCRYNDSVDIWALGIMAYEQFTNEFPFKIESTYDLIKIAHDDIDFDKIKCPIAKDFCSKALVRDRHYRADVWQLCEHELFTKYKSPE